MDLKTLSLSKIASSLNQDQSLQLLKILQKKVSDEKFNIVLGFNMDYMCEMTKGQENKFFSDFQAFTDSNLSQHSCYRNVPSDINEWYEGPGFTSREDSLKIISFAKENKYVKCFDIEEVSYGDYFVETHDKGSGTKINLVCDSLSELGEISVSYYIGHIIQI